MPAKFEPEVGEVMLTVGGVPPEPMTHVAGDEVELLERSMCILRLAKGSHEDAHMISWKNEQKAAPTGPSGVRAARNKPDCAQ